MKKRTLFKFRLYTADHTMNSTEALANLTALCALHLSDRHEIEVVNVQTPLVLAALGLQTVRA